MANMTRTSQLYTMYTELMEKADPRADAYPMMGSPIPITILTIAYIVVVQWVGPKLMENRKPFDLRTTMMVYNLAMVVVSGYIFIEFALSGWLVGYSYQCQPVDYSQSPQAMRMVSVCWLFYFSKVIEFLDTIFFVLRKKNNQISFLHIFHHGTMPISVWFGVKFVPGGFGTFQAWVNSFIHFVMYTYYGLAAVGPHMQKYLWWKKYMTKMQLTQFIMVGIHASQLLVMKDCDYPKLFVYAIASYAVIFLVMFVDFYVKAYLGHKKQSHKKLQNGSVQNGEVQNGSVANGLKRD